MITLVALTLASCLQWGHDAQGNSACVHDDAPRNELLVPRTAPEPERNPMLPDSWNAGYGYAEYTRSAPHGAR